MTNKKKWFESWFDTPYYHLLYQHRDDKEAHKFIKNLNLIKKKIKANKDKELKKILTNSKKVRKQIIDWKQDVSKPDFGREI